MRGMKTQLRSPKPAGVGFGAEAVGGFPGCIGRAGRLPVAPSALATGAGGEFPAGRVSFSGKVAEVRGEMAFFPVGMPSEFAAPTSELAAPASELAAPASELPAPAAELSAPAAIFPAGASIETPKHSGTRTRPLLFIQRRAWPF